MILTMKLPIEGKEPDCFVYKPWEFFVSWSLRISNEFKFAVHCMPGLNIGSSEESCIFNTFETYKIFPICFHL